jgi:trehalose 6-phosphate synthase
MNLVAKEFIAANVDENGVLLLSRFTGSMRQLSDALIVNPYAVDELGEKIHQALEMDAGEVQWRMRRLREGVRVNNIYKWASTIVHKIGHLS